MIKYTLACHDRHGFEVWFRSSSDCDTQLERGLVICPSCGSSEVAKALMAPQVRTTKGKDQVPVPIEPANPPVEAPVAGGPSGGPMANPVAIRAALRELRDKITESADYVGPKFAEEARKIHFGETEERGIYGEAAPEEVKALVEDGVDVLPLPMLPEEQN
ncbi:MAG: DUF1178 family protein [Pseudomonadota bacterium]